MMDRRTHHWQRIAVSFLDFVLPHCDRCPEPTTVWQRMTRFHLIARVALLGTSSTTASLAWWSTEPLTYKVLAAADAANGPGAAHWAMIALTLLTIVGWLDVIVNDALPDRWSLPLFARRRYWGFSLLGAVYWMHVFAALGTASSVPGSPILLVWYMFIGACCAWYSAVAVVKHRDAL